MSEPRREELVPLFTEFGLACYQAHLLEDASRLLLLAGRECAKLPIPDKDVQAPMHASATKTLGALLHDVLRVEAVTRSDEEYFWKAVKIRNKLIHQFWTGPRTLRISTPEGRDEVIEELKRICLNV